MTARTASATKAKYALRSAVPAEAKKALAAYPDFLQHLMFHRGITDVVSAEAFLNPSYETHTHDPFLLKDMAKAVKRVLGAVEKGEKIVIFSDYDADGIPGGVVLHDFFKKIGYANFSNYIPHRHDEGFGLNMEAVEGFAKDGAKLVITIDCGIADIAEVKRGQELGMDMIVTDHHLPITEKNKKGQEVPVLPPAFAILNPKQADCAYPEKMLCGSGVIFKLVQALVSKKPEIKDGWEKWLLDMVGMATLSDMVPLTGENRVFAYYGLKVLRKSPRVGLMKLLRKIKTDQRNLTEDDIGFTISPRINAASRMGVPHDAFRLLSTTDETEADQLSDHLNRINDERKGIVAAMVKEMKHALEARWANQTEKPKLIVLGNPKWKPALLGLAANTLMEAYSCPVFLWGRDGEDVLKGSCRSNGMSLQALMCKVPGATLSAYGGHTLAGGFAVTNEEVHKLEADLMAAYEVASDSAATESAGGDSGGEAGEGLFVDASITLDDVNWQTYGMLEKLAPFGTGNPKPLFLFEHALLREVKAFGKERNHIELGFGKTNGSKVSAIGFFSTPEDWQAQLGAGRKLAVGEKVHLVATLEKSTFRNFPELRLRIVDIF
ncbi:MAG: single-stranded-DNA-specific exonuclease RecJ [Patescibacteria group bacterium]